MNSIQARTIPIDRYLESQGIKVAKSRNAGRVLWYSSPIRNDDKTPSFKVDADKNLWYDHGLDRGGNIIDLVCDLCSCNVRDALRHLEKTNLFSASGYSRHARNDHIIQYQPLEFSKGAIREKMELAGQKEKQVGNALVLLSSSTLKHPALLQYLEKRKIDRDIAAQYLSQVDFKAAHSGGTYFGLGFPAGDGFEVRNALFKGFVGIGKTVSFHKGIKSHKLLIFEGFTDFLSYLTMKELRRADADVLVLNSSALKARALPYVQNLQYAEIQLFLDNDDSGNACTEYFLKAAKNANISDMRIHYLKHNDLNEWHCAKKS